LWFDYDGQPVRPTQRGRFVIVDENAPSEEEVEGEGEDPNGEPMPMAPDEPDEPEESAGPVEDENEVEDEVEGGDDDGDADDADDELVEPAEGQRLVRRDPRAEREAMGLAASVGLRQAGDRADLLLLPVKQMGPAVQRLLAAGWNVTADSQRVRFAGPPNLSVRSGIDWFELHGRVRFGEGEGASEATLPEVLAAARRGESTVQLGDGTVGLLPEQWLQQHGMIAALGETHDDHLRFDKAQGVLLSGLAGEEGLAEVDEPFAQLRKRLHEFDAIDPIEPPDALEGELRPYQKQGLGWLEFLRRFELSGILADDMGLGKTVQVLATLAERRPAKTDASVVSTSESADASKDTGESSGGGASLIVAPKSVVFNWLDEAQKFVPHLRVGAYSGTERHGMLDRIDDYDVLVTSYGLLRRDAEALGKLDLDYAVLDEAQAIKNPTSQSAKAARSLKARHRLALTGTPIENHLGDLWSIFEFLNPGMLGASTRFQDLLKAAPDTTDLQDAPPGQKSTGLEDLGRALRPFILRRTKKQVLSDLPTKTEQTIVCQMEPAQRKIYDELRDYYRGSLMQSLDGAGVQSTATLGGSAFMVLEALLRLRQAACHPGLITGEAAGVAAATRNGTAGAESGEYPSAKLDELQLRLGDVLEEGSKALVFSQFTSMLAIVRKRLEKQGIKYVYLDGQTRNRKDVVQQFQEDPTVQVFLISLKAGGTGLNLTAAEYVFLLDPWWNPAVEAQAIDRAHRIGQTRPVFAYRMICEDTVEQRILQLQQQKRQLAEAVVGGDQSLLRQLTRDDLEQLLA
jgi:superfamily II DNA or RNA helicase